MEEEREIIRPTLYSKRMKIKENIPLAPYTTFEIGGRAKYFVAVDTKEDLIEAVRFAQNKGLPFFILGGGSNLLVTDEGYDGIVINFQFSIFNFQKDKITAGAGTKLEELVKVSARAGLTGLEWAAGIPGTIGGAVHNNAAAFESSIGEMVKTVEVFDVSESKIKNIKTKDCHFGYKETIFKKNKNLIILSCVLGLKKGDKKEIKGKINYFLDYREKNHPLNFPSAGSIFKNPSKMAAGELIEKCGLKGKRIGAAQISPKHANFIVNLGKARSEDVIRLINLVKKEVKEKFKIKLKEEIQVIHS